MELSKDCPLANFLREIRAREIDVRETIREHDSDGEDGSRAYFTTLRLQQRQDHTDVIDDIRTIPGGTYLEEL